MPLVNFETKADFDDAYNIGAEPEGHPQGRPEIRLHYSRATLYQAAESVAANLKRQFNWPLDTSILMVGAGYGWTAEALEVNHGYINIATTDTSTWIQDNQVGTEEAEIDAAITLVGLNPAVGEGLIKKNRLFDGGIRSRSSRDVMDETLETQGSRNRTRVDIGDIQVAITENVLSTLSDAEAVSLATRIDGINNGITQIHIDTELQSRGQNPAYNWKLLADWKALLPAHTLISINTWEVL